MRTAFIVFTTHHCFHRSLASAQSADACRSGCPGARGKSEVKLSLEQVALLEGRIIEARPTRCPKSPGTRVAMRSRDPGLLNSPNFDAFPPEFRDALEPDAGERVLDNGRFPADDLQLQARQGAGSRKVAGRREHDVQRARQLTALDAIRAYNQLLFTIEQLRVMQTNVQSKQSARGVRAQPARRRCGHRARSAACGGRPRKLACRVDARRKRSRGRARHTQHGDAAPTDDARSTDRHACGRAVRCRIRGCGERGARRRDPSFSCCGMQERFQDRLIDVAAGDAKPSVDFNGSYGFAVRRPKNLFDRFRAVVGVGQRRSAALRRLADGRPRRPGPRAAQHGDAADRRARKPGAAGRADVVRRAGAREPHDSGGRAQRDAGAPRRAR